MLQVTIYIYFLADIVGAQTVKNAQFIGLLTIYLFYLHFISLQPKASKIITSCLLFLLEWSEIPYPFW